MIEARPEARLRALLAATLRTELQEPLNIRNGVCHDLVGISSAHGGQPAAFIWEIKDKKCSIPWHELQATFSWLSKVPFAMSMISDSPTVRAGSKMTNNAENWKWWLTEFGLDLNKVNLGTT